MFLDYYPLLKCYSLNDTIYFPDANSTGCDFTVGLPRPEQSSKINCFPNPTIDYLTIESEKLIKQIELYNSIGQAVPLSKVETNSKLQISYRGITPRRELRRKSRLAKKPLSSRDEHSQQTVFSSFVGLTKTL